MKNILTQKLPNNNALKFLLQNKTVSPTPVYFSDAGEAANSFLATRLFMTQGVKKIFFGKDFITITKGDNDKWDSIESEIISIISSHFNSGLSAFDDQVAEENNTNNNQIEKEIEEVINDKIRPGIEMDGGGISFVAFNDGIVTVQLHGACVGCPCAPDTIKGGVESILKHYIPEVKKVEQVF